MLFCCLTNNARWCVYSDCLTSGLDCSTRLVLKRATISALDLFATKVLFALFINKNEMIINYINVYLIVKKYNPQIFCHIEQLS